ncbi:Asp-tRNA(Asn)/Glu-tRNA(Gln) amidotransferase subunit GatB [Candidatus Uhrbacteria bacterium]|nr:Asp-tRNA(Asn)/Glu-tRNA(Gln) amidotransferase subunit GatB [Candidatus Uhrbacteria bacterium]
MSFRYVIGLEVHVQLATKSKMFCRCSNEGENQPPNTTVCPVCMGHPGTLPVMNAQAVEWSAKTALALNCTINEHSKFDRKNYFYPDLPKGYQISQYDAPIGSGGFLDIEIPDAKEGARGAAHVRLNRLHLEEDAAKLLHASEQGVSLVDFNRSSTPLMEIVSEPDMTSPQEAKIYLQELRTLVRALGVSNADMEKGHMRCDANISIKFEDEGAEVWTPISEIKNLNSFRAVEKALEYEGERLYHDWIGQGEVRNRTHKITVGWDDAREATTLQRSKEEAHDYRYFPEPDLPPLHFTAEHIAELHEQLPELPTARRKRLCAEYAITPTEAHALTIDTDVTGLYEQAASELAALLPGDVARGYKVLAGFIINKLPTFLESKNERLQDSKITAHHLCELASALTAHTINSSTALLVLERVFATGEDPSRIIRDEGLEQVTDASALSSACEAALAANPDAVTNYKQGKLNAVMFLVGVVMREMKGKAQPNLVKTILEEKLNSFELRNS